MNTDKNTNRLIHETSPYLLQHAHNPVDWYPWGKEALNRARKENKMIFLSIGYSSCHWCHVMAHESFENQAIADYLNEHFISIKVDREERPDLDTIYMEAVQLMSGQGGWPLNVWLTPDQIPIFGGTYFPAEPAFGNPGFLALLQRLVDLYYEEPDQIHERAEYMKVALQTDIYDQLDTSELSGEILEKAYNIFKENFDFEHGGFSGAPKFPSSMGIEFLLQYYHVTQNTDARNMAVQTLREIVKGGIFDQVGGGIHRYSTDAKWLIPHFEKMLYDNGLLISALCDGYQVTHDPIFKNAILKTTDFIKREMTNSEGGFYSALDADSEGVEGKYYAWDYDEIKQLLSDDEWQLISYHYAITKDPDWNGKIILHTNISPQQTAEHFDISINDFEKKKEAALNKLLVFRSKRVPPQRDEKIITSWNALVLKGLCKAYKCLKIPNLKQMAIDNAGFIINKLIKEDLLYRTYNQKEVGQLGFLVDYALFTESLTYLLEITGDEYYLKTAYDLAQYIREQFYDTSKKAFNFISKEHENIIAQPREAFDNAIPSGTSASIAAFLRVGHLSGEMDLLSIAEETLEHMTEIMSDHATSAAYNLQNLVQIMYANEEIILVGPEEQRKPFEELISLRYNPISYVISGDNFSDSNFSSLYGKIIINDKATAYLCRDFSCKEPVTTIEAFQQQLDQL